MYQDFTCIHKSRISPPDPNFSHILNLAPTWHSKFRIDGIHKTHSGEVPVHSPPKQFFFSHHFMRFFCRMSEQYEPVYGDWQLGNNTKLPTHHHAAAVKAIATHHGHAINVNCRCVIPCAMCEHVLKKCQSDNALACAPRLPFSYR